MEGFVSVPIVNQEEEESKSFQPVDVKPEFWDTYQPSGDEAELMKERTNTWAAVKTLEDLLPFGKFLGVTPSGRAEWESKSTKEKLIEAGLDALVLTPAPLIGKGFRTAANLVTLGKAGKFLPKKVVKLELQALDKIGGKIAPYVEETGTDILIRKYGLNVEEVELLKGKNLGWYLMRSTPAERMSGALREVLDKKSWETGEAKLKDAIGREVRTADRPYEIKKWDYYKKIWTKEAGNIWGKDAKNLLKKENADNTFNNLAREMFGEEIAKGLTLSSAKPEVFANMALRMMDAPRKYSKLVNIGILSHIKPIRFVTGAGEPLYQTYSKVYKPLKAAFESSNEYGFGKVNLFNWIVADKGLGKISQKITGDWVFKLHKESKDAYYRAGEVLVDIGERTSAGAMEQELKALYLKETEPVRKFIDTWMEWTDDLYREHFDYVVPRIFKEAKISGYGMAKLENLLYNPETGALLELRRAFAPQADRFMFSKRDVVAKQLDDLKLFGENMVTEKHIPQENLEKLLESLTFREKGTGTGFVNYLENYVTRISETNASRNAYIADQLTKGQMHAFYTKGRTEPLGHDLVRDIGKLVEGRARAQGKELFFYPEITRVIEFINKKGIPQDFKNYIAHWTFRMLGHPSPADLTAAKWLQSTYGKIEEILGLPSKGLWNERRVMNLAYNINNMVYMGGLGFKPFSALRNFVQYPLNVPTDLGGFKDIRWFFKGITKSANPAHRKYIRDIGAIQEFAPELHLRARAVPAGKRIKIGEMKFDIPDLQQARDMSMFMFKMTDRWNKYATGGAAVSKWDHYAAKFFNEDTGKVSAQFIKKMNIKGRNKWVAEELEDLLNKGGRANFEQAKKLFTNDVIADTQYLYGVADSPILSQTWGAPGKMVLVFQSWWMNYGVLLKKWMQTGDSGVDKANRLFTWMLSSAVMEQVMEPIWSKGTAWRTVGLGPFPGEISEFALPPAYAPFYHILSGAINIGAGNLESAERHGKSFLRSTSMFLPGGLQAISTFKGAKEEGWPGLLKSIIRYKKETDYEPLWGLLK